jgi:hypothetical protein
MTDDDKMREYIHEAAEHTVRMFMLQAFGTDIDSKDDMAALRADFHHVRRLRQLSESASNAVTYSVISIAVAALLAGVGTAISLLYHFVTGKTWL